MLFTLHLNRSPNQAVFSFKLKFKLFILKRHENISQSTKVQKKIAQTLVRVQKDITIRWKKAHKNVMRENGRKIHMGNIQVMQYSKKEKGSEYK